MMIADIATGHTWGADVCFLVAVIAAALAVVVQFVDRPRRGHTAPSDGTVVALRSYSWPSVLTGVALALIALGLLIL